MTWFDQIGNIGSILSGDDVPDFSSMIPSWEEMPDASTLKDTDFSSEDQFKPLPEGGFASALGSSDGTTSLTNWLNQNNLNNSASKILDPNVPLGEVASSLSEDAKEHPSFLTSLAKQLGVKVFNAQKPIESLANIIGMIGVVRNAGANGAMRNQNRAAVNSLVNSGKANGGLIQATSMPKPVYYAPENYISTTPNTGALSLIKTGAK